MGSPGAKQSNTINTGTRWCSKSTKRPKVRRFMMVLRNKFHEPTLLSQNNLSNNFKKEQSKLAKYTGSQL